MRLRKQSKPATQPGDEFLRALSSGPERRSASGPPAPGGRSADDLSGLRTQLLESERRAEAAGEAIRQMRGERDERLQQAREALAQERAAREAAERRVAELTRRTAVAEPEPEPPEPEVEHEPRAVDAEAGPPAEPMFPDGDHGAIPEEQEGDWPTPWLDDRRASRRGLFRRSRP